MKLCWSIGSCVVAVVWLAACETVPREGDAGPAAPASIDRAYDRAADRAARELLDRVSPILIVTDRRIVIYRDGHRSEKVYDHGPRPVLIQVSRVALTAFAALGPTQGEPLTPAQRRELARLRGVIEAAETEVEAQADLPPGVRQRQRDILNATRLLADEAEKLGRMPEPMLVHYAREIQPWMAANGDAVVREQIAALNRCMTRLLPQFTDPERAALHAVVIGGDAPGAPGVGRPAVDYFRALMGDHAIRAGRLTVAPDAPDERAALDALGRRLLGIETGELLYGGVAPPADPFADSSQAYIRQLALPRF